MIGLVAEHDGSRCEQVLRQVFAGEVVRHFEVEIIRRGGLIVPVSVTLAPVRNRQGRILGACGIVKDITEQTLALSTLAENEARLRQGEALAHIGGWALDVPTGTVQWSHELYRIHGIDPDDFDGTRESHVAGAHDSDRAAVAAAIEATIANGSRLEIEYRIVPPDGGQRWLYSRADAIKDHDGAVIGLRGVSQDVTERYSAQLAMREAYEREREAAELLRASNALKDEFLATVSHELRTPLTSIIGFSSLMSEGVDGLPVADLARRIQRNAAEMLGMVERLLDFSRLQAGLVALSPKPIDLHTLVSAAIEPFSADVNHRIALDIPTGVSVVADLQGMARIVGNLVSNACKFSPPGATIEITADRQGGMVIVAVSDHGPGIPADLVEKVFERFFQVPGHQAGARGSGVGLSIVQRYVELQGGRVWCDSAAGAGATFRFSLPIAASMA